MGPPLMLRTYSPDMFGFEVETIMREEGGIQINLRYGKEYKHEDEGLSNTVSNLKNLLDYFQGMEKSNGR
jgi:hypothetical protein